MEQSTEAGVVWRKFLDGPMLNLISLIPLAGTSIVFLFGAATLPMVLMMLGISLLPAILLAVHWFQLTRFRKLPGPSKAFNPFPASGDFEAEERSIAKSIADRIKSRSTQRFLVVSAPTGSGKTVVSTQLVPKSLEGKFEAQKFEEYDRFLERIRDRVSRDYESAASQFVTTAFTALKETGDRGVDELASAVGELLGNRKVLFIFDQAERLSPQIEANALKNGTTPAEERQIFRTIFNALLANKNFRVLFLVRDEELASFLSILCPPDERGTQNTDKMFLIGMRGINRTDDARACADLKAKLRDLTKSDDLAEKFVTLAKCDDPEEADTLSLKLAGYLYAALVWKGPDGENSDISYSAERRNLRKLEEAQEPRDLIAILLGAAFEHCAIEYPGQLDRGIFDLILYSVAADTKATGAASSIERVSALAHLPKADLAPIFDSLKGIGVFVESEGGRISNYRLAHDSIADAILRADELNIHSRAVHAIRSLAEERSGRERITKVSAIPKSFELGKAALSSSYIPIIVFFAFGLSRIVFSEPLGQIFENTLGSLTFSFLFSFPEYYQRAIFYVPTFLVQITWLTYIDRVNRAFIQRVTSGFKATAGNSLSTIGCMLGIMTAYSPQLILFPLVIVATIYGLLLIAISRQSNVRGEIRDIVWKWGVRTILNLFIASVFALGLSAVYADQASGFFDIIANWLDKDSALFGLILGEALILFWFWYHIREEQNTPQVWAATLALFDRGRMRDANNA